MAFEFITVISKRISYFFLDLNPFGYNIELSNVR